MKILLFGVMIAGLGLAQSERRPIGEIDFFGQKGLDAEAVRAALPLREGDMFPPAAGSPKNLKRNASERVKTVIGREATDVAFVCCDSAQRWIIYIGLPGESSNPVKYGSMPRGNARFPSEVVRMDQRLDDAWAAAVFRGNAQEDDSQGFALSEEPKLRKQQLALREYALNNEALILRVLESSADAKHRRTAAKALGYARQTSSQVEALGRASLDPDDEVRNNATRALGVLLSAKPELVPAVSAEPFIALLRSGVWSDHNKAVMVLDAMTSKRDLAVMNKLRSAVLDSLIEMARWRSQGHAFSARLILGRIGGIEEDRLIQLAESGAVDTIVSALKPR